MTIYNTALMRAPAPSIEDERAHLHALRRRTEAALETLLRLLDELDGDADLEPSLGWTPAESACGVHSPYDDEQNVEGDDHEREPYHDDNGIADPDGRADQFPGFIHGALL